MAMAVEMPAVTPVAATAAEMPAVTDDLARAAAGATVAAREIASGVDAEGAKVRELAPHALLVFRRTPAAVVEGPAFGEG